MNEHSLRDAKIHFHRFMLCLGLDPKANPHLEDTPTRFTKLIAENTANYRKEPEFTKEADYDNTKQIKATLFKAGQVDSLVIESDITFSSICAHHFSPFFGVAHVAYLPGKSIVGISKFARVTDYFCRRPQTQEVLTEEIHACLLKLLKPKFLAVMMEAEHCCYDDKTDVLTEKGFVRLAQLKKGEKVAQYVEKTGELEFVIPTAYVKKPFAGRLKHFKGASFDLAVTPEHRCYVSSDWDYTENNKKFGIKLASEINGDSYMLRTGTLLGASPEFIRIGSTQVKFSNYCKFMGAFLSEGCSSPVGSQKHAVRIKQDRSSKAFEAYAQFLVNEFEFKFHYAEYGDKVYGKKRGMFICSNSDLNKHLRQFGKTYNKFVPSIIKLGAIEDRDLFLRYFWLGDGGINCMGAVTNTTCSVRLANDLQMLFATANRGTSLVTRKSGAFDVVEHFNKKGESKNYSYLRKRNLKTLAYVGNVYCLSVPSTLLLVRRNGRTAISGNCVSCRGPRKLGAKTTTSKFFPNDESHRTTKEEFLRIVLR